MTPHDLAAVAIGMVIGCLIVLALRELAAVRDRRLAREWQEWMREFEDRL